MLSATQRDRHDRRSGAPSLKSSVSRDVGRSAPPLSHFVQLMSRAAGPSTASPGEIAQRGTSGAAGEVPYRAEMERSFGADFSDVRAHTDGAASRACGQLGAEAYATASTVAFKSARPDRAIVAHELTHVLQQSSGGPRAKSSGSSVDRAGEPQAEAVEHAVAAGQSARSALSDGVRTGGPGGPALAPSLNDLPTFYGSGSATGFEAGAEFELLGGSHAFPLAWPPGTFAEVGANVVIRPNLGYTTHVAGDEARDSAVTIGCDVHGEVSAALALGWPDIVDARIEVALEADGGVDLQFAPTSRDWAVTFDAISLVGTLSAGIHAGPGGVVELMWELARCDILQFVHGHVDPTGFHCDVIAGPELQEKLDDVRAILDNPVVQAATAPIRIAVAAGEDLGNAAFELLNASELGTGFGEEMVPAGVATPRASSADAEALRQEVFALVELPGLRTIVEWYCDNARGSADIASGRALNAVTGFRSIVRMVAERADAASLAIAAEKLRRFVHPNPRSDADYWLAFPILEFFVQGDIRAAVEHLGFPSALFEQRSAERPSGGASW